MYVDNYFVVGHDADDVRESAARHSEGLVSHGLPVHEVDTCMSEIDYTSACISMATPMRYVRLAWSGVWRLRLALAQIESARYFSGEDLQKVLGHITWACLFRRESLSVCGACYWFVKIR